MLKTRYKNYIIIKKYFKNENNNFIYDYYYTIYEAEADNKKRYITNYFNISNIENVINDFKKYI